MKVLAWYALILGIIITSCSYLEEVRNVMFFLGLANVAAVVFYILVNEGWQIFTLAKLSAKYRKLHPEK